MGAVRVTSPVALPLTLTATLMLLASLPLAETVFRVFSLQDFSGMVRLGVLGPAERTSRSEAVAREDTEELRERDDGTR